MLGRVGLAALVAMTPFVAMSLSVHSAFGSRLSDFRPYGSDEVAYWHQIRTFEAVGLQGGQYTLDEYENPSGLARFGFHGPAFPVLLGSLARLTGWFRDTPARYNAAFLGLALAAVALGLRLTVSRTLLLVAAVLSCWPVLYLLSSGYQESWHHAAAVISAALFAVALNTPRPHRGVEIGGWLLLGVFALVRPIWLFLFPAWAIVTGDHARQGRIALRMALAVAAAAVHLQGFVMLASPYAGSVLTDPSAEGFSRARRIVDQASDHLQDLGRLNLAEFDAQMVATHHILQVVALVVVAGTFILAGRQFRGPAATPWIRHGLVLGIWLISSLTAWLILYPPTVYGHLVPVVLFSIVVLCLSRIRAVAATGVVLVVANLLVFPWYQTYFIERLRPNFDWDPRPAQVFTEAIEGEIRYTPAADRWYNTLLVTQYPPELINVPAGIGISVTRNPDELTGPPRSRFLMFEEDAVQQLAHPVRLRQFGTLSYGNLYENLDAVP